MYAVGMPGEGERIMPRRLNQRDRAEMDLQRRRIKELEEALVREVESRETLAAHCIESEEALRRYSFELEERIKELGCLYEVSRMVERRDLTLAAFFERVLEAMIPAWRYPERVGTRIIFRGAEYHSGGFRETGVRQSRDILVRGERAGSLEVHYREDGIVPGQEHFLEEEGELLDTLAGMLSRAVARREMEEALGASEERYRLIYEYTGEAVFTFDLAYTLIGVNRKACEIVGYSEEELLGGNILELSILHPDDLERALDDIRGVLGGEVVRDELRFIARSGTEVIFEVTGAPLFDRRGDIVAVTNVAHNITEQKLAEAELMRINAELDAYAHVVSHDLMGPVSVITTASEALREMLGGPLTADDVERMERAVEMIRRGTDTARMLVEDLLNLAYAGLRPEDALVVDVGEVIGRVLAERSGAIAEKRMRVSLDDDLGHLAANPTHIYQLFANMVGNALAYNDSAGPRLSIQHEKGEDGVHRYIVSDNGPGIPPGDEEKVFQPLFKGESGGTGVGLAIVRKIVETYGGSIEVRNEGGARFEFTLRGSPAQPVGAF